MHTHTYIVRERLCTHRCKCMNRFRMCILFQLGEFWCLLWKRKNFIVFVLISQPFWELFLVFHIAQFLAIAKGLVRVPLPYNARLLRPAFFFYHRKKRGRLLKKELLYFLSHEKTSVTEICWRHHHRPGDTSKTNNNTILDTVRCCWIFFNSILGELARRHDDQKELSWWL